MDTKHAIIAFSINREEIMEKLHIRPGSRFESKVEEMIGEAQEIAKPKIAYKLAYIEDKGEDHVIIDGIRFKSRVLRVNLDETYKVIPFVITCGSEIKDWAEKYTDMFEAYCADGIMEWILLTARSNIFARLDEEYGFSKTADMNPGSLPDWPLEEQIPLFDLLGDVRGLTGVELSDHYLMEPLKTVSGFHFFKKGNYANCMLCKRENCPGRKAPYDENLYDEKYR